MLPAQKPKIKKPYIFLWMVDQIHSGKRSNLQDNYKYNIWFIVGQPSTTSDQQ